MVAFSGISLWFLGGTFVLHGAAVEALNLVADEPTHLNLTSRQRVSRVDKSWQTWGPYRPGLYFGVRPTIPDTLLMGLMWASGESRTEMLDTIRDTCEQNDGMQGYGWTAYDTRSGGSQTINDQKLHINLTTDFLKSEDGDSWGVRVSSQPRADAPSDLKTTVIFHAAVEEADHTKSLVCNSIDDHRHKLERRDRAEVTCRGEVPGLGSFEFHVVEKNGNKSLHKAVVRSVDVPGDKIWQAKSILIDHIKGTPGNGVMLESLPGRGNMHFIQMTFEGPFSLTWSYRDLEAPILDTDTFDAGLNHFATNFPARVDKTFPRTDPFQNDSKYSNFSQAIISNLLGGLGFFHGDTKVDLTYSPDYQETDLEFWKKTTKAMADATITTTPPISLLSFTPSRPFFPRGFLWDEGFHLLPVIEWDFDQAVSVLQSWLNLMDEDGWIGREQILGPEARSRVPPEFQTQYPHFANPPTFLSLLVPIIISKLTGESPYRGHPSTYLSSKPAAVSMLKDLYSHFSRHYVWFRRTQAGNFSSLYPRPADAIPHEGYRWRGRTPAHCLTSGLDDYPRASPPHPGELHLDALAWVGASASALHQLALYLEHPAAEAEKYSHHLAAIKHNLDALHWSPVHRTYCDATIDTSNNNTYMHVCRKGYLSLFPLLLPGLINSTHHHHLPALLDLAADESAGLWSPHGLRSLSAADEGYHRDDDYWRGAVWVNLNVLVVLRMRELGLATREQEQKRGVEANNRETGRRALDLARRLRDRLVKTVYDSWEETGFFWEQYSDIDGKGQRSRAFTGWTACVILLMGLNFESGGGGGSGSGEEEGLGPETSTVSLEVGWLGVTAGVTVVVAILVWRKKLAGLVGFGRKYFMDVRGWRRSTAGGQRYEPVEGIDLEERVEGIAQ